MKDLTTVFRIDKESYATLKLIASLIAEHGKPVYWWGASDSPHTGCFWRPVEYNRLVGATPLDGHQ